MGVQQPGMSGQVKEDIISRFVELGILVENGKITFRSMLLRKDEFLKVPKSYRYYSIEGIEKNIDLEIGTLAFTFCQVPIIYHISHVSTICVTKNNGNTMEIQNLTLDEALSSSILNRMGEISRLDVYMKLTPIPR